MLTPYEDLDGTRSQPYQSDTMKRPHRCPHFAVDKFGHCENCCEVQGVCIEMTPIVRLPKQTEGTFHYVAVYADADSHGVKVCEHQHRTVSSATACISECGGYVFAMDKGELLSLADHEETEFQTAMYATLGSKRQTLLDYFSIVILAKLGLQGPC